MSYTQKVIIRNLCGMQYFWGKMICSNVKSFWPLNSSLRAVALCVSSAQRGGQPAVMHVC